MPKPTTAPSQRQKRVAEEVRHTLARIFERGEIHHEHLASTVITITEVRMTADLRLAIAYFRPLNAEADWSALNNAMQDVRGYLRRRIGETLRLKFVPDLKLVLDESFDEAARIERLLQDPKVRQDLGDAWKRPPGDPCNE